jgi:ATP-binding cassette subfamily B protein
MRALPIYRRLLQFARPYWLHLGGLFALSLAATPIALLTPLPIKIVVDSVVGSRPLPTTLAHILGFFPAPAGSWKAVLLLAIALLLLLTLVAQLQRMSTGVLTTYMAEKLVLHFRTELFRNMQRLSLAYHDMKGSADSLYRIQYDAMSIQFIAVDGLIPFVSAGATLLAMVYVIARMDATLAVVAIATMPLTVVVLRHYRPRLYDEWRRVKKLESSAMSVVQEVLGAVRVVKAFGQEDREQSRFTRHSHEGLAARLRVGYVEGMMCVWIALIMAAGTDLVLYIWVTHVRAGTLTLGSLLLVMGYLASLYGPLETISNKIGKLQSHIASAERAFALLDHAPDVVERPDALPLTRAAGHVAFENVSFAYEKDHLVLGGVNLRVKAGQRVGVVGRTGAGKTTLTNLLLRFYDPTGGRITLDEVDLREYKVADLRNQFSVVLQDAVLFSTSIAENIAYAREDASEEEIFAAARAANAHDFIEALPDGYDTLVGERGLRLSGGERQRISLARAFLKNAPLLILDEPTSSVDAATESSIMEAMQRLMHGRTTFLITHRASTLTYTDVVVSVEDGEIVDRTPAPLEPAEREPAGRK